VLKIETESSATAAFCFHPFKPLLTTVDGRGVVRVINYQLPPTDSKHSLDARAIVNRFHLARGAPLAWAFCRATLHRHRVAQRPEAGSGCPSNGLAGQQSCHTVSLRSAVCMVSMARTLPHSCAGLALSQWRS